jgi:hypothetical protein
MFTLSSWQHLRFAFSFFLLPIFLFSLAISPNISEQPLLWTFLIVHFLLYPASNGYNSYFDKDEKSIGALKNPLPVNKGLYHLAILLDVLAIVLGYIKINLTFAVMLLIYGLVSKAYSHPSIRLKKYAITSWVITGLFQGLFTFVMCYIGINDYSLENVWRASVVIPGVLSSVMLWANYPITQVYQHEEDAKRGDHTFSLMLGIRGTFYFVGGVFVFVAIGFTWYFMNFYNQRYALIYLLALSPVILFFLYWFSLVYKDETKADYGKTMWLTLISATCLNAFFIYLFLHSTQILQVYQ